MSDISQEQLSAILCAPDRKNRAATWLEPMNSAMRATGITTPRRQAAFLAQVMVESADLRRLEENLSYSAERLRQVWPARFPDSAVASAYGHSPEKLANNVYAGRMGNGDEASGDGWKYRGRGLITLTGRDNYARFSTAMQIDALNHPDLLGEPAGAALAATWFWQSHGLNELADRLEGPDLNHIFIEICRRVSGNMTGLPERQEYWARARKVFGEAA